jgi:cytochrome c biogenesis protein CcmG/thiol:disulfide interchange protein DsbE
MKAGYIFRTGILVLGFATLFVRLAAQDSPKTNTVAGDQSQPEQSQAREPSPSPTPETPKKGTLAPDFTLADMKGGHIGLSSLKGKAVVLNFWATWCGPCKIEMPWLVDLQKKYGPQGLQIVGVAMDDASDKEILAFAHKMGVNYVVLRGSEKIADLYGGLEGLPATFFLDRSGTIVDETMGLVSESVIEDAIKQALGQQDSPAQEKGAK